MGREEVVLDNQQHLTITTKRIKPIYRLTYLTKKLVFCSTMIIIIMKAIFFSLLMFSREKRNERKKKRVAARFLFYILF